jgi:hypothetical protein
MSTFTETVLETTLDILQVSHTASTGGLSALTLFRPVDYRGEKFKYAISDQNVIV